MCLKIDVYINLPATKFNVNYMVVTRRAGNELQSDL